MSKKLTPEQQAIISASDAGLHATTIELAQRLLNTEPDNVKVLIDLGHACWQIARYGDAEKALTRAIELCDPGKRDVLYGELGNLHRVRGDFATAAAWYTKQIEHDPADATGYLFLGTLQLRQGDLDLATATLQRALVCEYGCLDEVHFTLGIVALAQQEYSTAVQRFEHAIAIDPQHLVAKQALKDARRSLELHSVTG